MAITVYTYNDKVLKNVATDKWLKKADAGPDYNPLGLPPNTVRVRTNDGNPPTKYGSSTKYETATLVPGTTDVYDVYKSGTSMASMFDYSRNVVEILGANTTGITDMSYMFDECIAITSVALFDTSSVTNMAYMFYHCAYLAYIPLFDTSSVTDMRYMFYDCGRVNTGALALYQQASSQTNPPSLHASAFEYCGESTTTGAAELAQIPSSWGGTAS